MQDKPEPLIEPLPGTPGGRRPDSSRGGLLDRVKRILETILEKFNEAEREREIIALLKSIEEKLANLDTGANSATLAEVNEILGPVLAKMKKVP